MTEKLLQTLTSALLMLAFTSWNAQAQEITEPDFHQEGDKVAVTFHLDRKADIYLYVSTNGGVTFQGPLKNVTGDIGDNVSAGRCKILWDPIAEFGGITGDNICFKITANSGKYVRQKHTSSSRYNSDKGSRNKFLRFGIGMSVGGLMITDEDESVFTFSIPMELSLGRVDQRFNFAIGETFSFMKNTVQFTTAGILRLRILELIYLGIGGGLNINLYSRTAGFLEQYLDIPDNIYNLEDIPDMMSDTLPMISGAVIAEAGMTFDNIDMALNYKYDFMSLPGYSTSGTIAIAFKYYF